MTQHKKKFNPKYIELIAIPIATGIVVEALRELLLGGWEVNRHLIIGAALFVISVSVAWVFVQSRKKEQAHINRTIRLAVLLMGIGALIVVVIKLYDYYLISSNTIVIDPAYHHLGDLKLEFLEPEEPEGTEYTYSFFLPAVRKHSFLSITAKDVDQNLITSGVVIAINDVKFTYLNLYFQDVPTLQEHTAGERLVVFSIPEGILKPGMNTISIFIQPDPYTGNIDDIQFRDLKIILK